MMERTRDLDIQHGKDLVRGVRAWQELEDRRRTGLDIIDFRLAPSDWILRYSPFFYRKDVLRYFQRLAEDIHRDTSDGLYLGAKVDGLVTYLGFLTMEPRSFHPRDHFELGMTRIAGYIPRLIPGPEVDKVRGEISTNFSDRYELPFDRNGWLTFRRRHGISPTQARKEIAASERAIVSKVAKIVGARSLPRVTIRVVNEETDYWLGWVRANSSDTEFRINEADINSERYYDGVPVRMLIHELGGHGIQARSFADNTKEESVNPGRVETTVPGVEQWLLEAWASEISRLYPSVFDGLTDERRQNAEMAVELQYLTDTAYTNAQYELLISGRDRKVVVGELADLLPHEPTARIELILELMTTRLDRMFYLPVYGDGSFFLRQHVESLPEEAKRRFTNEIHRQPMTPDQVKSLVAQLQLSNS
ncbi:hypothetical protein HYS96_02030 [Candidatus Daviesbacteria bacterium]|nr:hypothetical protein [Candidatus Daviesbacteria bacterium]